MSRDRVVLGVAGIAVVCALVLITVNVGPMVSEAPASPAHKLALHASLKVKTAPTLGAKTKGQMLDVRDQAKLVHHPHMKYVNDVDQGLNDALENIRKREIALNNVPLPPHEMDHEPQPSHNLDQIPIPPKHVATLPTPPEDDPVEDEEMESPSSSYIPEPPLDAVHTEQPANKGAPATSAKIVESADSKEEDGEKDAENNEEEEEKSPVDAATMSKRFAAKHKIMTSIHNAENEAHDRLRLAHDAQVATQEKQNAVSENQDSIHEHQQAVADAQQNILTREARIAAILQRKAKIASYLDKIQHSLARERSAVNKATQKQFAKIVEVEQAILEHLKEQTAHPPEPSHHGGDRHVRVNVNKPGAVHVKVHARHLGDHNLEINLNEPSVMTPSDDDNQYDSNVDERVDAANNQPSTSSIHGTQEHLDHNGSK